MPIHLKEHKKRLEEKAVINIYCRLSPGAKNTEIKEIMADESIKIRVSSAPEKGKANLELRKILAKEFEVSLNNVKIIRGLSSKFKTVEISK